jgi:hypothetical protein
MKRQTTLSVLTLIVFLFSAYASAGDALRNIGNGPGNAQPSSSSFGKTLDGWMEAYLVWFDAGADPDYRDGNVAFLPIAGESPFEVEVEPGTAFVLPIATWLGVSADEDPLPDDWWGDRDHIFGDVYLDGQPIAVPNEDYYVGPSILDPPVLGGNDYYQALVVVIPPLTPGLHEIILHSEFVDFAAAFDNTWYITVTPPGKR